MSLKKILMLEQEAMMILDSSNGGFNGITTSFYTTDLKRNEVVRRYFKALQGGYVIPNAGYGRILDGSYVVNDIDDDMGNDQNIYKIYSVKLPYIKPAFILFNSF